MESSFVSEPDGKSINGAKNVSGVEEKIEIRFRTTVQGTQSTRLEVAHQSQKAIDFITDATRLLSK